MKTLNRTNLILILLLLFFISFSLVACRRAEGKFSNEGKMVTSSNLKSVFEKTKKICFGRFLIEVPLEATVVYGPSEVETPIHYFEGEVNEVNKHVLERMRKVEYERQFFDEEEMMELPLFGKVIDGVRENQKIVIGSADRVGYSILSLVPVQNDLFEQIVDGVLPEQNFIEKINKVASVLRFRGAEEVPSESGMCIESGFVPGVYEYERATIGIRFKEFPDVHLSVDVHKNLEYLNNESNPRLLHERAKERAERTGHGTIFSRVKILRDGTRKLGNLSGHELALKTPAYKSAVSVHDFRFYSPGAVNDPFHPQLDIRFDSGVKENAKAAIKPSITDEEALVLWEMLISTIRLRQPSDATPMKKPKLPLNTQASTGATCPESGWWETSDKRIAVNERRRLVEAGVSMPHAYTVAMSNLWDRLTGGDIQKITTTWKLVAYDNGAPNSKPSNYAVSGSVPLDFGDKHA